MPFNLSSTVSQFLRRHYNTAFAEVTGAYVINRGAGYGLEVPCDYRLFGPEPYITKLQEILKFLQEEHFKSSIMEPRLVVFEDDNSIKAAGYLKGGNSSTQKERCSSTKEKGK